MAIKSTVQANLKFRRLYWIPLAIIFLGLGYMFWIREMALREQYAELEKEVKKANDRLIEARRITDELDEKMANETMRFKKAKEGNTKCRFIQPKASDAYEKPRQKIRKTIENMWKVVEEKIKGLQANCTVDLLDELEKTIQEHRISIISDWNLMSENDGFKEYRAEERKKLEDYVQRWFGINFDPSDGVKFLDIPLTASKCSTTKFLDCGQESECELDCQIMGQAHCFLAALSTKRLMKLYNQKEFRRFYEPFQVCYPPKSTAENTVKWPGKKKENYPIMEVDNVRSRFKKLINDIPHHLKNEINHLVGEPQAWWMGQILKYMLKVRNKRFVDKISLKINFNKPIVAVQIIRHENEEERKNFPLESYMDYVEEYFDMLELTRKVPQRRILLSTDEPDVIKELKEKYPNYKVIAFDIPASDNLTAKFERYILDTNVLIKAPYFVCALSAPISRRVYEFMYQYHIDADLRTISLDDHHYINDFPQLYTVLIDHKPFDSAELEVKKGDRLTRISTSDEGGISKFKHRKTSKEGFLPLFKVEHSVSASAYETDLKVEYFWKKP